MKKLFTRYFTMLCFLLLIGGFYAFSLYPCAKGVHSMLYGLSHGQKVGTGIIEAVYKENFPATNFFVTVNGGFQRLMGVRHVNDIAKLDNGYITYLCGQSDVDPLAMNTVDFHVALEERDIPFLYVNAPFKISKFDKMLPAGVEDYSNENADRFLSILRENGVNVLDLRDEMKAQGIDHYDSFYSTDHHWTAETGFWASTQVVEGLRRIDESFAVDSRIQDLSNYNLDVHEKVLLGSSGRRTGPLYAGIDDLTLITPKYDTSLRFNAIREALERTGSYRETLIFDEHLYGNDVYYPFTYATYCGNDYPLLELENMSGDDGLDVKSTNKRIVLIKDSFSEVVIPFLALSYDEMLCIDMRALYRNLLPIVEDFNPDAVVVLYNPGAYTNNEAMFNFTVDVEN